MTFGPYADGHCFRIEKSSIYKNINKDVKIAEFLLLKLTDNKIQTIQIVEAKETAPNLTSTRTKRHDQDIEDIKNELTIADNLGKLEQIRDKLARLERDEYFDDVREKFINSLSLFIAIHLHRHPGSHSELPAPFTKFKIDDLNFQFVLVIKKSKEEWLPDLKDKLEKLLKPAVKTWHSAPQPHAVIVLNEDAARRHGLVS